MRLSLSLILPAVAIAMMIMDRRYVRLPAWVLFIALAVFMGAFWPDKLIAFAMFCAVALAYLVRLQREKKTREA